MLNYDPTKRKTAKELLKTNYIKKAKLTAPEMEAFPIEKNDEESSE